jgi:hypothetical protein
LWSGAKASAWGTTGTASMPFKRICRHEMASTW